MTYLATYIQNICKTNEKNNLSTKKKRKISESKNEKQKLNLKRNLSLNKQNVLYRYNLCVNVHTLQTSKNCKYTSYFVTLKAICYRIMAEQRVFYF